jgi:hypothetical protein
MIVALHMRVVSTGQRFITMSDSYANETYAIAAALKDHPDCVVSRHRFPSQAEYDAFVAYVHAHPNAD